MRVFFYLGICVLLYGGTRFNKSELENGGNCEYQVTDSGISPLLDSFLFRYQLPGITATVIYNNGRVADFSSGYADTATNEKLTPGHKMMGGSTGKLYFAISILQLAQQGKLELDEKAAKYLGKFKWFSRLPNSGEITIRQLMNHTAGMEEYFLQGDFLERLKSHPDKVWTKEELLGYLFDRKPLFPAGSSFSYADSHYLLLEMIIEEVEGTNAFDYIGKNVTRRAALKNTAPSAARHIEGLTNGYSSPRLPTKFNGPVLKGGYLVINPQFEGGGGGFATCSHDLALLVHTLFEGRLIADSLLQQMKIPYEAKSLGPDNFYGLGLQIMVRDGDTTYGHSGWFPGWLSDVEKFKDGYTIAVQMNADMSVRGWIHPQRVVHAIHQFLSPGNNNN